MEGRGVRLRTQGLAKLVEDMRVIKAPFPVGVKPGLRLLGGPASGSARCRLGLRERQLIKLSILLRCPRRSAGAL